MAMIVGQAHADPVTGMAGRIYTAITAAGDNGFSNTATTPGSAARNSLASFCEAIATAVVAEIQANATVTIKTSDAGLQRDNTGGNPATLAPSSNKTLPGGAIQ